MKEELPNGGDKRLEETCREFMRFGYALLGAYLDAMAGLDLAHQDIINRQKTTIAGLKNTQPEKASEEFLDTQVLDHILLPDPNGPQELLHRSTQGDFKRRTAPGGLDARFLSQMFLALLYGAWEDNYRGKVAAILGQEKNALKSDLFQDINKLRQAILHQQGIANEDVERAKIIRWFRRGDAIYLSRERAGELLDEIDHYVSRLCGLLPAEEKEG